MKINKNDITTTRVGENYHITTSTGEILIFSQLAVYEFISDISYINNRDNIDIAHTCKYCGEFIRPLKNAPEIFIHISSERRNCRHNNTMAEIKLMEDK